MTGFGRADAAAAGMHWRWEAKSVNGRGLDLKLRLPPGWDEAEAAIRQAVASRFRRGSIQLSLQVEREEAAAGVSLDEALLERLLQAGAAHIAAGRVAPPRWDGLLALRGVLRAGEPAPDEQADAALRGAMLETLPAALDALLEARAREGAALAEVLGGLIRQLQAALLAARQEAAAAPVAHAARLRERVAALAAEVDPARMAQEIALLAAKGDVTEELERLEAHLAEAAHLLGSSEPVGRRLDFLTQELTREANTLCAKSQSLALTRLGLDMKAMIDQFREQAANVE